MWNGGTITTPTVPPRRCTEVIGKPIPAEKLKLGEPRSAARLRECKALLAEELEKLLEENRQYL